MYFQICLQECETACCFAAVDQPFHAQKSASCPYILALSITASNSLRCVTEMKLMRSGKESNPGPPKSTSWTPRCSRLLRPLLVKLRAAHPDWRFLKRLQQAEMLSSAVPRVHGIFDAHFFLINWTTPQLGTSLLLDGDGMGGSRQPALPTPAAPPSVGNLRAPLPLHAVVDSGAHDGKGSEGRKPSLGKAGGKVVHLPATVLAVPCGDGGGAATHLAMLIPSTASVNVVGGGCADRASSIEHVLNAEGISVASSHKKDEWLGNLKGYLTNSKNFPPTAGGLDVANTRCFAPTGRGSVQLGSQAGSSAELAVSSIPHLTSAY